jgi:ABC-type transport system involved in Fe-S cluster assembly fused permease/ATPase subunit
MNESENISLQPLIEADPVPFTMETLGWKILLFIIIAIVLFLIFKFYKNYKKNQCRRDAISKINKLNTDLNDSEFITQTMFYLKQTALKTYDRKVVAALNGEHWLSFIDEKVKTVNFLKDKELIASAIYENKLNIGDDFNREAFKSQSIKWIRNHV